MSPCMFLPLGTSAAYLINSINALVTGTEAWVRTSAEVSWRGLYQ